MATKHVDIVIIARPNSRKESISQDDDGKTLVVCVTEQPERGKANKAILKQVAKWLGIGSASVTLIQGSTSTTKKIRVEGMDDSDFKAALQKLSS